MPLTRHPPTVSYVHDLYCCTAVCCAAVPETGMAGTTPSLTRRVHPCLRGFEQRPPCEPCPPSCAPARVLFIRQQYQRTNKQTNNVRFRKQQCCCCSCEPCPPSCAPARMLFIRQQYQQTNKQHPFLENNRAAAVV